MSTSLAASIAHAHAPHLHSLVLHAGPPMVRLYFADVLHNLWKNEPRRARNQYEFPSRMSVAVHSHRQDITMVHVLGEVVNVGFSREPFAGGLRCSLDAFEYRSAIVDGRGAFVPKGSIDIWGLTSATIVTNRLRLRARDLHTVFVPRGRRAAWLIVEGDLDPGYDPTCYSNDDLAAFDFSGLYKPMTADMATRILRACNATPEGLLAIAGLTVSSR